MPTTSAAFDAQESVGLPNAPPGKVLSHVSFATCPGTPLRIACVRACGSRTVEPTGVYTDAWWTIASDKMPVRSMRLRRGGYSLFALLKRYAFADATGCVNHRRCTLHYDAAITECALHVQQSVRDCVGVPQFYKRSGVCWFASMCWTAFGNDRVRALVLRHHPEDLRVLASRCLFCPAAAEAYRKALWYRFAIGDDVDDDPLKDGQNGAHEFLTLCATLRVPVVCLREQGGRMRAVAPSMKNQKGGACSLRAPSPDEDHLLLLRFIDGDHAGRFRFHRRLRHEGRRYRLAGFYLGQRKCGHQCALVCTGDDWRYWGMTDADAHTHGIGPEHFFFSSDMSSEWWDKWKHLVNVTKYGSTMSDFCPLSPWNLPDDVYDKYRGGCRGSNSVDALFTWARCTRTPPRA